MSALASAQRPIITLALAGVTFVLVYRLSTLVARSRGWRYYRHILILYQAAGSRGGNAGWLWQVTLAPTITTLAGLRVSAVAWLISRRRWINRNVLGSQSGMANQDLVRVRLGGIISAAVVGVASNGNLVSTAAGALVGVAVPLLLARRHNHRHHLLFAQQLPQVLSVMINAIRAGRSLGQTIDVIAEQVAEPARSEFLLVAQRRRLGGDLSEGLRGLAERLDNDDLQLLVNALVVQRETGGNLLPVLQTIYATVRERLAFQGEIRTLTAQVRMTARVITALPFILFGVLYLINPIGMSFFWNSVPLGPALGGGAVVLIVVGNLIMGRMAIIT